MKPIRSFLQHNLNSLHVFTKLLRIMDRRMAMGVAKAWEKSILYRAIYA